MSIIRTSRPYTVVNSEIFEDPTLSWAALGFLIFLLSDRSNNHELSPKERKILDDIVKAGYAVKNDDGTFSVFDEKQVSL